MSQLTLIIIFIIGSAASLIQFAVCEQSALCELCTSDATKMKSQWNSENINQIYEREFDHCKDLAVEEALKCVVQVTQVRDTLLGLCKQTVAEFCNYYGACPSSGHIADLLKI